MVLIGDDYPVKWKNLPLDAAVDSWGMYTRECTSFVANRLSVVNKFNITRPPSNWNANVWGQNAQNLGYQVDKNPTIGSVAWWNAGFHVAWVADVKNGSVLIEEYNNPAYSGNYNNRWINAGAVDGYIHFKDLPNVPEAPKLPPKNPAQAISKGINYETHVSKVGWMNNVKDGALSGSTGYKLPVEAIRIIGRLSNGSVEYRAHVSTIGWMPWVKSGQVAGTTGQSKAVEAIQARLTGDAVNYYNLEYQAHVAENGWLSWVKDGQTAGTTGQKKSLQAIKMKLVRKPIVQGTAKPVAKGLAYQMHLAKEGWLGYVTNNQMAGTTGLSIEGQCIEVYVNGKKENVKIDAHVAEKGWIENVGGTVGKQLSLQAVKISLKNGLEKQYNISYQVHVAEKGWMAWVENGAVAGTTGQKLAIQAIKIKLIAK